MTNRTRMIAVGVIAPLAIALVGEIFVLMALPGLPDPIATHWGSGGTPDGFGSAWVLVVMLPVLVLGYAAFALAIARNPAPGFTVNQRAIFSIGPFLAVLLSVTVTGSLVIQDGLEDARNAPTIAPWVALGFGLGALAGVVAWFLLPTPTPVPESTDDDVPVLALADTERATWTGVVEPTKRLAAGLGVVFAALFVGGGAMWVLAPLASFGIYAAATLLAAALVASLLFWRVTVDAQGLRVRSSVGIPRYEVSLNDVDRASVVTVDPARDFGGWGVRWGGRGRLGVITRRGDALEVHKRNGKSLVVTVPGSRTAAALLNALAKRVQ